MHPSFVSLGLLCSAFSHHVQYLQLSRHGFPSTYYYWYRSSSKPLLHPYLNVPARISALLISLPDGSSPGCLRVSASQPRHAAPSPPALTPAKHQRSLSQSGTHLLPAYSAPPQPAPFVAPGNASPPDRHSIQSTSALLRPCPPTQVIKPFSSLPVPSLFSSFFSIAVCSVLLTLYEPVAGCTYIHMLSALFSLSFSSRLFCLYSRARLSRQFS
ncbi:hypothetical protein BC629DRAFT_691357 [Irpex lacteus]|nr:hypothetical protein BC629DRAFT_691357 [Irpex lacteus]